MSVSSTYSRPPPPLPPTTSLPDFFPPSFPSPTPQPERQSGSVRRRAQRPKERYFNDREGKSYHAFGQKAPYPVSYDKDAIDLDAIDNSFIFSLRDSNSFVDYVREGGEPPTRVLDLGCGSGVWTLAAAKEWPECEFVGFDLVDLQPPLSMLPDSLTGRVQWVHGNFLTTKLPFEDDEFDHVHVRGIARAVPENKWDQLFEEINRVLVPGGVVEMLEEDIVFPTLPRWFTQSLRMRASKNTAVHYPFGSRALQQQFSLQGSHDHAILELLFDSVYDTRFVNRRPLAILPSYFSTYFRNVICGPVANFPMPPLPPIPEPPRRTIPIPPTTKSNVPAPAREESFSSTDTTASYSMSHASSTLLGSESADDADTLHSFFAESAPSSPQSEKARLGAATPTSVPPPTPYFSVSLTDRSISAGASSLLPLPRLESLGTHTLAMHLRTAYMSVVSIREPMWDELLDRIRNKVGSLNELGWDTDDEISDLSSMRKRFDVLFERFVSDMEARTNIGSSLESVLGWKTPRRDPLTKAELVEEERIHQAMWEARQNASLEELHTQKPSRSVRVLVGRKALS